MPANNMCAEGHNYQEVPDSASRATVGKDTHNNRAFFCSKCGDVITRTISVWKDFIPKHKYDRKTEAEKF